MTRRGLFLADGTSDLAVAGVIERIAAAQGHDIVITAVDPTRYPGVGKRIDERLAAIEDRDQFDVVFVHRDAERDDPSDRRREIADGAAAVELACPVVPVVPVRMTEAWLLLDEPAIRSVAGRPNRRRPLELPTRSQVERVADPKAVLRRALTDAAEVRGRRARQFDRDFGRHRALLIERLDIDGPVSTLSSWQQLVSDIDAGLGPSEQA